MVSSRTLATLYWGIAKMRGKTANKVLRTLEGVIKDGADKVSMQ